MVLLVLFAINYTLAQEEWEPYVTYPHARLEALLQPTETSFRQGTFQQFGSGGNATFSALLSHGHYEKKYKPRGSVEVWLDGFHRVDEPERVFVVAEYHKISIGGSSSNDCFVDVVEFENESSPLLRQQIAFGCDLSGSGSKVSQNGRELIVRQAVKGDPEIAVFRFQWDGGKFVLASHSTELLRNH